MITLITTVIFAKCEYSSNSIDKLHSKLISLSHSRIWDQVNPKVRTLWKVQPKLAKPQFLRLLEECDEIIPNCSKTNYYNGVLRDFCTGLASNIGNADVVKVILGNHNFNSKSVIMNLILNHAKIAGPWFPSSHYYTSKVCKYYSSIGPYLRRFEFNSEDIIRLKPLYWKNAFSASEHGAALEYLRNVRSETNYASFVVFFLIHNTERYDPSYLNNLYPHLYLCSNHYTHFRNYIINNPQRFTEFPKSNAMTPHFGVFTLFVLTKNRRKLDVPSNGLVSMTDMFTAKDYLYFLSINNIEYDDKQFFASVTIESILDNLVMINVIEMKIFTDNMNILLGNTGKCMWYRCLKTRVLQGTKVYGDSIRELLKRITSIYGIVRDTVTVSDRERSLIIEDLRDLSRYLADYTLENDDMAYRENGTGEVHKHSGKLETMRCANTEGREGLNWVNRNCLDGMSLV
eukprot:NODE_175_length_15885_cov_0.420563.p2 type:complete len:458 gc:universal NODE_175_length_15885_cov_0.420563:2759-1386(-)